MVFKTGSKDILNSFLNTYRTTGHATELNSPFLPAFGGPGGLSVTDPVTFGGRGGDRGGDTNKEQSLKQTAGATNELHLKIFQLDSGFFSIFLTKLVGKYGIFTNRNTTGHRYCPMSCCRRILVLDWSPLPHCNIAPISLA